MTVYEEPSGDTAFALDLERSALPGGLREALDKTISVIGDSSKYTHVGPDYRAGWLDALKALRDDPALAATPPAAVFREGAALPAGSGAGELDAAALAQFAYEDRPPVGRRPVPWTPVLRREWTAWANRMVRRLRERAATGSGE